MTFLYIFFKSRHFVIFMSMMAKYLHLLESNSGTSFISKEGVFPCFISLSS